MSVAVQEKRCAKCQHVKASEEFRRNDKMRDGLNSWCKACAVEATCRWRRAQGIPPFQPAKPKPVLRMVRCQPCDCGQWFTPRTPDQRFCSKRCKQRDWRWRRAAPARRRHLLTLAAKLRHWQPNPTVPLLVRPTKPRIDPVRITAARLAGESWVSIARRYGTSKRTLAAMPEKFLWRILDAPANSYLEALRSDPCAYCGGPGGERDHIVPRVIAGGETSWRTTARELDNLTGVCGDCNRAKRDRSLLDFLIGGTSHQERELGSKTRRPHREENFRGFWASPAERLLA